MYIIQNALKNVARNRGRNILLGTIIFAIISTTVITLCINNTASGIIDDYKTRFGSEVIISPDMNKLQGRPIPSTTIEQRKSFAQSEYIKEYLITASAQVAGKNIKAIDEDSAGVGKTTSMGGNPVNEFITPTMQLLGNLFNDFKTGMREIIDGKLPEKDNECVISRELAEMNNIAVGDSIEVVTSLYNDNIEVRNITYSLIVTGIYFDATEQYGMFGNSFMNRRNEILTTADTITNPVEPGENGVSVSGRYFLKDPDMLSDFTAEIRAKGLDDIFKVSVDEAGYNRIVEPVEGLKNISITFMIIVLILGSIILVLLSSIAIRERKYEIGVLRAMGMKKGKVAFGLWSEMIIITAVCLVVGLGAGAVISQPVSNVLLAGQIENAKDGNSNSGNIPGIIDFASDSLNDNPIEELDISLDFITMLEIIAISLLLASVAGVTAISKITKYEPIKILMERN